MDDYQFPHCVRNRLVKQHVLESFPAPAVSPENTSPYPRYALFSGNRLPFSTLQRKPHWEATIAAYLSIAIRLSVTCAVVLTKQKSLSQFVRYGLFCCQLEWSNLDQSKQLSCTNHLRPRQLLQAEKLQLFIPFYPCISIASITMFMNPALRCPDLINSSASW